MEPHVDSLGDGYRWDAGVDGGVDDVHGQDGGDDQEQPDW